MAAPRKIPSPLPEAVALRRKISVQEAASMVGVHEDTFREHFPHLIKRVGPRLDRVVLGEVLEIGQSKS
jgi:hypothetical protein